MEQTINITPVKDQSTIEVVAALADEIWRQHYTSIIGTEQVNYMLDKFQSAAAISEQIGKGAYYYILYCNENPSGYFSYYLEEDHLFLSKIYVKESERGKGFGREMMKFIVDEVLLKEKKSISLTVNKNNDKSIAAYQKMGFKIIKPLVMDIGGGFVMDDYYMEKQIN